MKAPKGLGMLLLAIWFVLYGILTQSFVRISFSHSGDVLALLAIAVGVVLFMKR
jgi:hypothetical protein